VTVAVPLVDALIEVPVAAVGRTVAEGALFTGPVHCSLEPQRGVPSEAEGQHQG
jgi:hypothetical protein